MSAEFSSQIWRRIAFWIVALWLRTPTVSEDMFVVIHNKSGEEVYREGPYSSRIITREIERCVHRITIIGLDQFLRSSR